MSEVLPDRNCFGRAEFLTNDIAPSLPTCLPAAVQHSSLACGLYAFHTPDIAEQGGEAEKRGEKGAEACSWISGS